MEAKSIKILVAAFIVGIMLLAVVVLWHSLGICWTFFVLAGIDLAAVLAILSWVVIRYATGERRLMSMARRLALEGEELRLEYSYLRKVAGLPAKFSYEVLQAATDDFHALIGRGSSASVFKGILNDGTEVAVKRIQGYVHGESEFRSEVTATASVQHVNLVRLLGYCLVPSTGARFLVYEYAPNGSLDRWIFPRRGLKSDQHQRNFLPWPVRYRVAVDVAKALAYLHNDCRLRVLHLDMKPENILLDENFHALVSDFGLSKTMGKDESRIITTVRGTRGYLAPEWFLGQGVSEKCDIFSYGLVLLELVSGRRSLRLVGDAAQRDWSYLPRIVMEKVHQGKLMEVVDERLIKAGVSEREVRIVVYVALWCIREEAQLRPSMAQVVDMLQGRVDIEAPPLETEMLILDLMTTEHIVPLHTDACCGMAAAAAPRAAQLESPTPVSSTCSLTITVLSGR